MKKEDKELLRKCREFIYNTYDDYSAHAAKTLMDEIDSRLKQEQANGADTITESALHLHNVSQQRELLIGLLTKLENGGGSAFIDKEQIVDDYLKAN